MKDHEQRLRRLEVFGWSVLGYNVLVILWGAVVRASGSGAGCGSHWPLCNGELVPRAAATATLVEFSHRLTSGLALLLVVALLVAVFRARPRGHAARRAATWAAAFMLGEAAVGAMLVLFELVADNRSMARGLFMAVHLLNTFLLLAALTLTAHLSGDGRAPRLRGREAALLTAAAGLLLLASVSGAVAALGDTLFPSRSLAEALRADLSATSHLLIRLRVLHPFAAVAAAAGTAFLALRRRAASGAAECRWGAAAAVLAVVQTGFGLANVLLLAPVWMQIVHLLLADALWIAFLMFAAHRLGEDRSSEAVAFAGAPLRA